MAVLFACFLPYVHVKKSHIWVKKSHVCVGSFAKEAWQIRCDSFRHKYGSFWRVQIAGNRHTRLPCRRGLLTPNLSGLFCKKAYTNMALFDTKYCSFWRVQIAGNRQTILPWGQGLLMCLCVVGSFAKEPSSIRKRAIINSKRDLINSKRALINSQKSPRQFAARSPCTQDNPVWLCVLQGVLQGVCVAGCVAVCLGRVFWQCIDV